MPGFTDRKLHPDESLFIEGHKRAHFYKTQYWRVKTNCRETYNDFEIIRFVDDVDHGLELPADWEDFLSRVTKTFVEQKDPFHKQYWREEKCLVTSPDTQNQ